MSDVKPWQIVVISAAVVAVGASAYLTFARNDAPKLASQITVVDLTTGELYTFPLGGHKGISVPGKNPETGKTTLFPVSKDESGVWKVSVRDLGSLSLVQGDPAALLDRKTGEVKVAADKPRAFR